MVTREILNSHPVKNLKAELSKVKKSFNYGSLKKNELVDLMMKNKQLFSHIKMYEPPQRKKPEPKPKEKPKTAPKAKPAPVKKNSVQELRDFVLGENKFRKQINELAKKNVDTETNQKFQFLIEDEFDEYRKLSKKLELADLPINFKGLYSNLFKSLKKKETEYSNELILNSLQGRAKRNNPLTESQEFEMENDNLRSLKNTKPKEEEQLVNIKKLILIDQKNKTPKQKAELRKLIKNYKGEFKFKYSDMPFEYIYGAGRTPALEKIDKNIFTYDSRKKINFRKL